MPLRYVLHSMASEVQDSFSCAPALIDAARENRKTPIYRLAPGTQVYLDWNTSVARDVAVERGHAEDIFRALRALRPEELTLINAFDLACDSPVPEIWSTSGTIVYRSVPPRWVRRWAGLLRFVNRRELAAHLDEACIGSFAKMAKAAAKLGIHTTYGLILFVADLPE